MLKYISSSHHERFAAYLRPSASQALHVVSVAHLLPYGLKLDLAAQGKLTLCTKAVPLSTVAETWNAPGKPRLVYTPR